MEHPLQPHPDESAILDALAEIASPDVEEHVARCGHCQQRVAEFQILARTSAARLSEQKGHSFEPSLESLNRIFERVNPVRKASLARQLLKEAADWASQLDGPVFGFDAALGDALGQRLTSPEEEVARTIRARDPIFYAAAGEGDEEPIPTQPGWFTVLREPPEELTWEVGPDSGFCTVVATTPEEQIPVSDRAAGSAPMPAAVRQRLPRDVDVIWEVRRSRAQDVVVRSVFRVLGEAARAELDRRLLTLSTPSQSSSPEEYLAALQRFQVLFDSQLFDELLPELEAFTESHSRAMQFFSCRGVAAVYDWIAHERAGDPEAIWARERSDTALNRSYACLGLPPVS